MLTRTLRQTVPPATEPVDVATFKAWARIDTDEDDALIAGLILPAARAQIEADTGYLFVTQTWRLTLDRFPGGRLAGVPGAFELAFTPLQSIASFTYVDTGGASVALALDVDYIVDAEARPARVAPAYGTTWPSTLPDIFNAVTVDFVAGAATSAGYLPDHLAALLLLAAHYYENREEATIGQGFSAVQTPEAVARLTQRSRLWGF